MKLNSKLSLLFKALLLSTSLTANSWSSNIDSVKIVQLNIGFPSLREAFDHLRSHSIQQDISIQLLYADYPVESSGLSTQGIDMNGYHLAIFGNHLLGKSTITVENTAPYVLKNHLSNFSLHHIVLEGSNPLDASGAVFHQLGNAQNIQILNTDLVGGYCGFRAAHSVENILLENVGIEETTHGALRIGEGDFTGSRKDSMLMERGGADFDVRHVHIKNLQLRAPEQNDYVAGTAHRFNGTLFLKRVDHIEMEQIEAPNGLGSTGIHLEDSRNIEIHSIKLDDFGYNQSQAKGIYLARCANVEIRNSLLKTRVNDSYTHVLYHLNMVHDLKFCHNTGISVKPYDQVFKGEQMSMVKAFSANLLHSQENPVELSFRTINHYQATLQVDWQKENYNVFVSQNQYFTLLKLKHIEQQNFELSHSNALLGSPDLISYQDYRQQYMRGEQSVFDYPASKIQYVADNDYHLAPGSLGRNAVLDPLCPFDLYGNPRSYPSDAGALDADNIHLISVSEPQKKEQKITLYPNPARDHLQVELETKVREGLVSIINTLGQTVKIIGINQVQQFHLKLSLKPGYYVLAIKEGNTVHQSPFIVN